MKIAVIGVGQGLRGDDAAGPEVVRRWQAEYPVTAGRSDVCVESTDVTGLALLDLLDGVDGAVLVDAVQSDARPGTLHRLDPEDVPTGAAGLASGHGWGLAETLQLSRLLAPSLKKLHLRLVGIEVGHTELGAGLSDAVRRCLASAVRALQDEVLQLLAI